MSEVYFEVRVTDKGGMEIHSCGTLEEKKNRQKRYKGGNQ